MKSTKLTPRSTKARIIVIGFMISLLVTIFFYYLLGLLKAGNNRPAIVSIVFFWIWAIVTVFLMHHENNITVKKTNAFAVVGVVREIQHGKHEEQQGREIVKEDVYPVILNFQDYLADKGANRNIAISGMARSGKTFLLYWLIEQLKEFRTERGKVIPLHLIIFQAKSSDRFKELGIPTLFIKNYVPNVFADPDSFVMAWRVAFSLTMRGITAVRIEPMLLQIVKSIQDKPSWENFKIKLDEMLEQEKRNISAEALGTIQSVFRSIAVEDNTDNYRRMANMELPQDIVVDFENVNTLAFAFYGEFLLRQMDKEIETGQREGTSIMIDEAHLFNRQDSIIPHISAVISSRGSLIVATQQISSIAGQIKGNCGTQFCFRQLERQDLIEVSALSESFHWIAQRLNSYEFVDLAQAESHLGIKVIQIFNPKIEWQKVNEWIPQRQESKEEKQEHKDTELDYPKIIIEVLATAGNVQDIGKRIAEKYGGSAEKHRLKVKGLIAKMVKLNEINIENVDFIKFVHDKPYISKGTKVYFRKGEIPSSLHAYLCNATADTIYRKKIVPKIMPVGIGVADIETDSKYVFEIETGRKNAISDLTDRIEKYAKLGKNTVIVVPNEAIKSRYKKNYPKVSVLTLPELWEANL